MKREAEKEIVSLRSFIYLGGPRLQQLLCELRVRGAETFVGDSERRSDQRSMPACLKTMVVLK
jgi:hypothetical protein